MDLKHFSRLVGDIYAAGYDPSLWSQALDSIKLMAGGEVSTLFYRDSTIQMGSTTVVAVSGWPDDLLQSYHLYFGNRDTRAPAVADLPVGGVYVDDRQMAFADVARTEIFADFYKPAGLGHAMSITLFKETLRHALLSIHRRLASGPFTQDDIALFELLSPHVVRALQIQRQIQRSGEGNSLSRSLIEKFSTAVLVVDANFRILDKNRAAETLLSSRAAGISCSGSQITEDGIGSRLRKLVDRCTSPGSLVTAPPPILRYHHRGSRFAIMGVPTQANESNALFPGADVVLFINHSAANLSVNENIISAEFGLTLAEASIVASLCQGMTTGQIAQLRDVSPHTIRDQLKSAYDKTEATGQAHLISLIARSLAVL